MNSKPVKQSGMTDYLVKESPSNSPYTVVVELTDYTGKSMSKYPRVTLLSRKSKILIMGIFNHKIQTKRVTTVFKYY